MYTIRQPKKIIFGINSCQNFEFPENILLITSSGAKSRGWINYLGVKNFDLFDSVEPNPSIETVEHILTEFSQNFSVVVGLGGGSSLDVAKFVASKMKKPKILIPTTFGSGSEVTRISVLKVNGKKRSFHDDKLLSDISIIDPFFVRDAPMEIIKNSAIDACAQCTEAFDSKLANYYTKFLCNKAFDILENAILENNYEDLAYGALISGLGFGNSSTTLGHALSYVYSNEGISHGHALAFTTTVAHKFNNSQFYDRFKYLVKNLNFSPINLELDLNEATKLIQLDRKHLDYNPKEVSDSDIVNLLSLINSQQVF
ncbi:iron-containing alcohol dehydrogenase [Nitrosopumilus sp.]|uniref:iron-containing alcohol dehydrogenase n=1 Tax=Nitrosopumilus sp. TaxID=2024843 RepID=UPI003D101376